MVLRGPGQEAGEVGGVAGEEGSDQEDGMWRMALKTQRRLRSVGWPQTAPLHSTDETWHDATTSQVGTQKKATKKSCEVKKFPVRHVYKGETAS